MVLLNKYKLHLIMLILLFSFVLLGFEVWGEAEYDVKNEGDYIEYPISILFEKDPTMKLLGKSFSEITKSLGEPVEKGYSEIFGPHQYMLYEYDEGYIRLSSPESFKNEVVISIILGPGQKVLGTTVGMPFSEIIEILGTPNFGPEIGIDDLYYLDYFSEKISDQVLGTFISFAASSKDSPTEYAFIKKE